MVALEPYQWGPARAVPPQPEAPLGLFSRIETREDALKLVRDGSIAFLVLSGLRGAHRSVHCPRYAPRCGNCGGSRADHLEGAVPGRCGCAGTVDGGGSGHHRPQSDRCDVLRWEQRISCDHHADSLDSARRGNLQAGSVPTSCETCTRHEWLGRAINRSLTTAVALRRLPPNMA